ncbi:hypothetical protein C1H46_027389 [Malus baccata]|uniref:NAC domain-containing protein n=1 Tax=Malus baccata TaxID=106549 RepID=A0A540LKQ5_MALBA|nr:hypothetical protein C1H46_027389 [Malus baccata]
MEDLPPEFRFSPTEEELISVYLQKKLDGRSEDLNRVVDRIIPVVYIYELNPWELPRHQHMCSWVNGNNAATMFPYVPFMGVTIADST